MKLSLKIPCRLWLALLASLSFVFLSQPTLRASLIGQTVSLEGFTGSHTGQPLGLAEFSGPLTVVVNDSSTPEFLIPLPDDTSLFAQIDIGADFIELTLPKAAEWILLFGSADLTFEGIYGLETITPSINFGSLTSSNELITPPDSVNLQAEFSAFIPPGPDLVKLTWDFTFSETSGGSVPEGGSNVLLLGLGLLSLFYWMRRKKILKCV